VMGSGLGAGVFISREKVQIAWEREEVAFMAVVPVTLALVATSSSLRGERKGEERNGRDCEKREYTCE
jgi:hypothetical protein